VCRWRRGVLAGEISKQEIAKELNFYLERTLELATAGKPYPKVVGHFASAERLKKEAVDRDSVPGSIYPDSKLFHEITYYFGEGKKKSMIVAVEFMPKPNTFDLNDMKAVFGEWRRSPPETGDGGLCLYLVCEARCQIGRALFAIRRVRRIFWQD